ncbi:MAG: hypothetical protein MUF83_23310 [Acidimicrobiales bacterium]|jgi:putative membrane protein|nr:hypothetical protein [Acidimicrobiales bacterium]
MMHWYSGPWSGTAWVGMALMMLLWAAVIGLAVWGIARAASAPQGRPESARDVLDRRLAAGEIDAEEYAQARHLLQHHDVSPGTPA